MSDEVKLEGKMAEFVDWIETISVLELSQLVKALEEPAGRFRGRPGGGGGGSGRRRRRPRRWKSRPSSRWN
jgi:hypothetical protein